MRVITSYSIHYTKLYDETPEGIGANQMLAHDPHHQLERGIAGEMALAVVDLLEA